MPVGRYRIVDDGRDVGSESFRCGAGPAGWRYFSQIETQLPRPHRETVDLAVDAAWRPVRLLVDTGEHRILVTRDGDRLVGTRDGDPVDLPFGEEAGSTTSLHASTS